MTPENRQGQAGQHEDDCCAGGQFAEERLAACGTENRVAGAGAEGCADFSAFAALDQDDADQREADQDVY